VAPGGRTVVQSGAHNWRMHRPRKMGSRPMISVNVGWVSTPLGDARLQRLAKRLAGVVDRERVFDAHGTAQFLPPAQRCQLGDFTLLSQMLLLANHDPVPPTLVPSVTVIGPGRFWSGNVDRAGKKSVRRGIEWGRRRNVGTALAAIFASLLAIGANDFSVSAILASEPTAHVAAEPALANLLLECATTGKHAPLDTQLLKQFQFALNSEVEDADFSMQFEARGVDVVNKQKVVACRRSYECRHQTLGELVFTDQGLPLRAAIDGDMYGFYTKKPWRHIQGARWAFIVTTRPIPTWDEVPNDLARPGGVIRIDLGHFLNRVVPVGHSDLTLHWSDAVRTLQVGGPALGGVVYDLRFRTPNDEERFGTAVSQVRNSCEREGSSISWSHFIVGKPSVLRFLCPAQRQIVQALGGCETRDFAPGQGILAYAPSHEDLLPLWDLVAPSPRGDERATDAQRSSAASGETDKIVVPSKYLELLMLSGFSGDHENTQAECRAMGKALLDALRLIQGDIRQSLQNEAGAVGIDDPLLLWRAFELHTNSREAFLLFRRISAFIERAPVSLDLKCALCDSIADMGTPCLDSFNAGVMDSSLPRTPFFAAILHSHWQWACTPEEVEACLNALNSDHGTGGATRVAVEALIRMDEIDAIPAAKLDAWFRDQVVNGDKDTQTEALRILSLAPNGQKYLMARATDPDLDAKAQSVVINMLVYRAESTIRTKRFDFISEPDCGKILAMKAAKAGAQ